MLARLFVVVVVLGSTALTAQEEPSRLPYEVPDGWTRGGDGRTLLPPDGHAAVTFLPSIRFSGTGEQWLTESWNGLCRELKLIAGAEPGRQGSFLTRIGHFQQADGTNVWVVLNTLVQDGRGEAVIFFATSQETFRAHLPTLSAMLQAMPAQTAAASGSSRARELMKTPAPPTAPDELPSVSRQGSTRAMNNMPTLDAYDFIPPVGWLVQKHPDHILLAQAPDQSGCVIQVLAPQPSSADLEAHAAAVFEMMYPGWQYQKTGELQYALSRGVLPAGFEYAMKEAAMSTTSADGRYHLEEGVVLVIKAGSQVAIVAVRHRGTLAHNDCQNKYETWRRFFNSFTVKGAARAGLDAADPAQRIVGVWSQSGGGAIGDYIFAANGHYAFAGGLGSSSTSRDDRYEYLHIRSHAWDGDGTYAIAGSQLTLSPRGGNRPEKVQFRFEQVNRGGAGWTDRLWLLKRDSVGEVEIGYDKKPTPAAAHGPTASLPLPSTSAQAPAGRRGPPIRDAVEVAGLCRQTREVFDANPFGPPGSGHAGYRMYLGALIATSALSAGATDWADFRLLEIDRLPAYPVHCDDQNAVLLSQSERRK
jgi:hypothetical protein